MYTNSLTLLPGITIFILLFIESFNLTVFLDEFSTKFEDFDYDIKVNGNDINVELKGNESSKLIGYRGETLNSIQIVIGLELFIK